ncbi:MAG: hypothetical protein RID53_20495 [Coleofasciculus sp. B1-GNL1-01]|uniref:hypothetical protein n=1 Tax=Coleofasciculus sp. B1-GNL1-01 TaxID=3068484 RepID=UPI0032F0B0B3
MKFSELSLGIKKPLLSAKPLGQMPSKLPTLGLLANSNVHNLDILSSTGRTVLAAISQKREKESVKLAENAQANDGVGLRNDTQRSTIPRSWVSGEDNNEISAFYPKVNQAKSFPQLPLSWQDLNTIISLGQFHSLGRSSLQSLQVLNLTFETSINQELGELSLSRSENDQNRLPESSFSRLNSISLDKSHSDLNLDSQSSSQTTPTSWESLAELIGEDSSVSSQDSDDEDIEGFMFTPEGFRPIYANPIKTSGDGADSIEAEAKTVSETYQTPKVTVQPSSTVVPSSQSNEPELVSESNLRMLAQEVYKLVRQRLQIERERYRR